MYQFNGSQYGTTNKENPGRHFTFSGPQKGIKPIECPKCKNPAINTCPCGHYVCKNLHGYTEDKILMHDDDDKKLLLQNTYY